MIFINYFYFQKKNVFFREESREGNKATGRMSGGVGGWGPVEVGEWLNRIGMASFAPAFQSEVVTFLIHFEN